MSTNHKVRADPPLNLLWITLLVLLTACGTTPVPQADSGWQQLYTRPGWTGGPTLDLRAVGDVMLARGVAGLVERDGPAAPFASLGDLLDGDLALGNLESPLSARHELVRPGPYRLLAAPELAPALRTAGFSGLGLANNHTLDAGPIGLAETLATLHTAGVTPLGAATNEQAALSPLWLERAGLRIALLAFNDVRDPADPATGLARPGDSAWSNPDFVACGSNGTVCPAGRAWLSERALAAIASIRDQADLVVVLSHWGAEYSGTPSVRQRAWAARLVAAGADLVLGAHPHVLQPATVIEAGGRHGFVAYSLGNFIFDAPADPTLSSGAVLRVLLDRDGVAMVSAAPVATAGGRTTALAPTSTEGRAALAILASPDPATAASEPGALPPSIEQATATPLCTAQAWHWDGAAGQPLSLEATPRFPVPATYSAADLRGDGVPLWATLDVAGVVTLRDGPEASANLLWRNEDPAWRFTRMAVGDPNDDGRTELLLLLEQPDATGVFHTQPYLLGWRGGRYRIIWGGSATPQPIREFALADLEGDGRNELVVLEGHAAADQPATSLSVWRWHGWGFQLEWRSAPGCWQQLALLDLNNDGRSEIVAGLR